MQPAYFIGLPLPRNIESKIQSVQAQLYDQHSMRNPLQPHITLVHPAALATIAREHYTQSIKPILKQYLPLDLQITNIGMFGTHSCYLGIKSNQINDLFHTLASNLPPDIQARYFVGTSYTPHVTLLQAKQGYKLRDSLVNNATNAIEGLHSQTLLIDSAAVFRKTALRKYVCEPIIY